MSVAHATELLSEARFVVSFSGAGLSQESGIATFRDPGGLWDDVDPMEMASSEALLENPARVLSWYDDRRAFIGLQEPNPAHRALASARDMGHITQNIDMLLERAGAEQVAHLHGTIDVDRCHHYCGFTELVPSGDKPGMRDCPDCGAMLRPSVVLFGEQLPMGDWNRAQMMSQVADVMLVVGTSAQVYPAAGLIEEAQQGGAKIVVVNTNESGASGMADIEIIGPAGVVLPEILRGRMR
jgi:NAD-dependent deacetylase